jgi:hypothetical protein
MNCLQKIKITWLSDGIEKHHENEYFIVMYDVIVNFEKVLNVIDD